jgi:hypothetical protein
VMHADTGGQVARARVAEATAACLMDWAWRLWLPHRGQASPQATQAWQAPVTCASGAGEQRIAREEKKHLAFCVAVC